MNESRINQPYQLLGGKLKTIREQKKISMAELSGAVEIDLAALAQIEQGITRPPEDILLLLISYFRMQEDEATQLWEMAGYDQKNTSSTHVINDLDSQTKPTVMVMPFDARIVYTDMVHVMVNNYGVVLNFMQGSGPNNQPLAVSRIGMSKEHAYSILEVLKQTLEQADKPQTPKSLTASKQSNRQPKSKQ